MGAHTKQNVEPVEEPLDDGVPGEAQARETFDDEVRRHGKRSDERRLGEQHDHGVRQPRERGGS